MDKVLKRIPVPIVALMLALFALGNLVQSYSNTLRLMFASIGAIILILFLIKIFKYPEFLKEELKKPIPASVLPAFSMGLMLLAGYIKPLNFSLASWIWYLAIGIHIALIALFTRRFINDFKIKTVFPSWFIVYVGIAVAAVSAPVFENLFIGKLAFWFAFICYILLMPLVIKRLNKCPEMPEPAKPTFAILAAPASLLLAGYINSFQGQRLAIVYFLLIASQVTYFIVLFNMPRLLKNKFNPSFAAFTFPVVISGIGLKLTNGFLNKNDMGISFLPALVKFEELIALIVVIYVLLKYIDFLTNQK